MIGIEEKELIAYVLDKAADALGYAIRQVDVMARRDIETVRAENAAADQVVMIGPEIIKALRTLARRYVR